MSVPQDGQNNPPPQIDTTAPFQNGAPEGQLPVSFWSSMPLTGGWPMQAGAFGPSDATMAQFPSSPFSPFSPLPSDSTEIDEQAARAISNSIAHHMSNNPGLALTAQTLGLEGNRIENLLYVKPSMTDELNSAPTPMRDVVPSTTSPRELPKTTPSASKAAGTDTAAGTDKTGGKRTPDATDKIKELTVKITTNPDDLKTANVVIDQKGRLIPKDTKDAKGVSDRRPFQIEPGSDGSEPGMCKVFVAPQDENASEEERVEAAENAWNQLLGLKNFLAENKEANLTMPMTKDDFIQKLVEDSSGNSTAERRHSGGPGSGGNSAGEGQAGGSAKGASGSGGSCGGGENSGEEGSESAGGKSPGRQASDSTGDDTTGKAGNKAAEAAPVAPLSHGIREASIHAVTNPTTPMNQMTYALFAANWYSGFQRIWAKDKNHDGKIDKDDGLTQEEIDQANKELEEETVKLDAKLKEMSGKSPQEQEALTEFAKQIKDHSKGNTAFHKAISSLTDKTNNAKPMAPEDARKAYESDLKTVFPDLVKEGKPVPNPVKTAIAGRVIDNLAKSTVNPEAPEAVKKATQELITGAAELQKVGLEQRPQAENDPKTKQYLETLNKIGGFLHRVAFGDFGFAIEAAR